MQSNAGFRSRRRCRARIRARGRGRLYFFELEQIHRGFPMHAAGYLGAQRTMRGFFPTSAARSSMRPYFIQAAMQCLTHAGSKPSFVK
jgi:hypothetical protein